jgi:hypothetical protein
MKVTTAMLADAARAAEDDHKLYIHGGGWDRIFATTVPTTHPSLAVVLLIEVDYSEALIDHRGVIELIREGEPVGVRAELGFKTGHSPHSVRGESALVPLTLTFPGLRLDTFGTYEWVVSLDDEIHASLPMRLVPITPSKITQS